MCQTRQERVNNKQCNVAVTAFNLQVVDISCGYYHSALVTEEGEVWTWGEGEGGKLGQGAGCEDCDTPR